MPLARALYSFHFVRGQSAVVKIKRIDGACYCLHLLRSERLWLWFCLLKIRNCHRCLLQCFCVHGASKNSFLDCKGCKWGWGFAVRDFARDFPSISLRRTHSLSLTFFLSLPLSLLLSPPLLLSLPPLSLSSPSPSLSPSPLLLPPHVLANERLA